MTLSDLSIKRPVFAWMLMSALIVFGGVCVTRMGISQNPDVDYPVVNINLNLQGAAPEVMETDVVDVVENAVMTIQGVQKVNSSSKTGSASVTVQFALDRNIDLAQQDVQAKLQQVLRQLPRDLDPPSVTKTNPEDNPVVWLTLESDTWPLRDMMIYVRDVLKNQFTTVPGVGDVRLGGYVDPNLRVWVDDKALARYALTVDDVVNTITREHSEPPAGFVEEKGRAREYNVRTLGEATTVEQFQNLNIVSRGGQANYLPIHLSQVARVEEGLADIRRLSRSNGTPAIGLGIQKQRGSNEVAVAEAAIRKMEEVRKTLPKGMNMAVRVDNSRFIRESVEDLNLTLLLSILLTAGVCWAFLGSWSSTLNVLLAIPTSIVGTFIFLYFSGFTLNTFTLMALSLAIGIVVDDAIMVLENITRHQEMGKGKITAALDGARQITFAALAATLAIVAIFLPVAFMRGVIGKYFFQFGVTMTVAVMLSLLEALTLTPMRASQFSVKSGDRTTRFGKGVEASMQWLREAYGRGLAGALKHRWTVVLASAAVFLASLLAFKVLPFEFVPSQDQSRYLVAARLPVGTSLEVTSGKFKEVEKVLASRPEVAAFYVAVGGFGGGEVNSGNMFVTLKPKGQRGVDPVKGHELSQSEAMAEARAAFTKIEGMKASIRDLSVGGFSSSRGFPVEFTVQGPDFAQLATATARIMDELNKTGLVTDLDTDYRVGQPEIHVIPDRAKAAARGVSVSSIGQVINAMIGSVVAGQYPKAGHRYDIRVAMERREDLDPLDRINGLFVRNNRGELIPVKDVVQVEKKAVLQSVNRLNRERAVSVYGNLVKGRSQTEALAAVQEISARVLPVQYHIVLSGSSQDFQDSFNDLYLALILGVIVAYMVLASQFNSFLDPVTVLTALPFSLTGALLALMLRHQSMNIYSMIGLILLMGLVKKNSILLVEFTNQVREDDGLPPREALLKACPIRLRPIVMTSLAVIVGALPGALAFGPGSETRIPMAVAVIGGVMVSTLLTLFVVPCVYHLFTGMEGRKAHHLLAEENAGPVPAKPPQRRNKK